MSALRFHHKLERLLLQGLVALAGLLLTGSALAHSSSSSYLTLSQSEQQLVLRADIHLRDLDLLFDLDTDGDGRVTWGEIERRTGELNAWMVQGLTLGESARNCDLGPVDLQASEHADGLYLSAQWKPACPGLTDLAKARFKLRYELIFAQDNLHRGLLKVDLPGFQSSAILSPDRPQAELTAEGGSALAVFGRYVVEGVWHIWIGIDHILFLLSLLLLAPLITSRGWVTQWRGVDEAKPALQDVLAVVTAFTVAHSITLALSVLKWLEPPADLIEPAIALSVVAAALNNLVGWSAFRRWRLAFAFGLIHGFGFANVLLDLGLPTRQLAASLGGFNVGVELGQLAIVAAFFPIAWLLRHTAFYRWVVVAGGSLVIAVLGLVWTLERTGLLKL